MCLASLSSNPTRPRLAAHFCSHGAGFPWGPMDWPSPAPIPSWPQLTLGGGVEAGPPPGPLPPCPAFQGRAASVHCWAGSKKQWLPLERWVSRAAHQGGSRGEN